MCFVVICALRTEKERRKIVKTYEQKTVSLTLGQKLKKQMYVVQQ